MANIQSDVLVDATCIQNKKILSLSCQIEWLQLCYFRAKSMFSLGHASDSGLSATGCKVSRWFGLSVGSGLWGIWIQVHRSGLFQIWNWDPGTSWLWLWMWSSYYCCYLLWDSSSWFSFMRVLSTIIQISNTLDRLWSLGSRFTSILWWKSTFSTLDLLGVPHQLWVQLQLQYNVQCSTLLHYCSMPFGIWPWSCYL